MVASRKGDKLVRQLLARHREVDELNEGLAISTIRARLVFTMNVIFFFPSLNVDVV